MNARWPFFASLISTLEMALFKTDLGVAERYLRLVDPELREQFWPQVVAEHDAGQGARCWRSPASDRLLAGATRLQERLAHRDPWVDPLSHLQVELLERVRAGADADRQALLGHRDGDRVRPAQHGLRVLRAVARRLRERGRAPPSSSPRGSRRAARACPRGRAW